jgi:NADH-quinone oxidoreductase subunit N
VSVYFYLRVVVSLYLRPAEEPVIARRATLKEGLALGGVSLAILILGIFPTPLLELIYRVLW